MKIYAACLASYNNGILHGAWIDADSNVDTMQAAIDAMLRASPCPNVTREDENGVAYRTAEEFAIHDFDGLPNAFGEYCGLAAIAEFVELCEEFDHIDEADMVDMFSEFFSVDEMTESLRDNFCGIFDSFRDYADDAADEMLACHDAKPDSILVRYFDYAAWSRDLEMDMRTVKLRNHSVAVFHN